MSAAATSQPYRSAQPRHVVIELLTRSRNAVPIMPGLRTPFQRARRCCSKFTSGRCGSLVRAEPAARRRHGDARRFQSTAAGGAECRARGNRCRAPVVERPTGIGCARLGLGARPKRPVRTLAGSARKGARRRESVGGNAARFLTRSNGASVGGREHDYRPGVFPNNSRSGDVENVGHYTQLIWRDPAGRLPTAVGPNEEVLVCRYSQAGNVYGERPA